MKINFDHEFMDEENKPVVFSSGDKNPLTFKTAAVKSLLYPPAKVDVSPQEKVKRHDLAVRIANFGSDAIINEEDKILIMTAVGQVFIPVVVGAAFAILDGKEVPKF